MPEAGWYPDPAGDPTRCRFYDGTAWTDALRPTADFAGSGSPAATPPGVPPATPGIQPIRLSTTPSPAAPVPPVTAQRRPLRAIGAVIGVVAVVLTALAVVTGFVLFRHAASAASPSASVSPTGHATPSGRPTPGTTRLGDTTGEFTCFGGSVAFPQKQPAYTSYGVRIEAPDDWSVRFDKSQWTWLHDAALWGKNLKNPSGVALGGVRTDHGFSWDNAVEKYDICMRNPGPVADAQVIDQGTTDTTVAGMRAKQHTYVVKDSTGETWNSLYVIDSGVYGGYATMLAFAPNNPAAIDEVRKVVDAAKRAS